MYYGINNIYNSKLIREKSYDVMRSKRLNINDEIFSTMDEIRKHEKSLLNILNQLSRVYKELFNNSNNPHTTFSGIPEQFSGDNNLDNNLDKFLDF